MSVGDTGEKVKELLKDSGELLANGLEIINKASKLFGSFNLGSLFGSQRRLLREENSPISDDRNGEEIPRFVNHAARKLLNQTAKQLTPNVTVALDGSGQYKTIGEAINQAPLKSNATFVILVKAGLYKEIVMIPKKCNNLVLLGEGPTKTVISGDKSFKGGYTTYHTSTLSEFTLNSLSFTIILLPPQLPPSLRPIYK